MSSSDLLSMAQKELSEAKDDGKHPFRTFGLATQGASYPELRTVVLRDVGANLHIIFFTDSRSPKVGEIMENPQVSALFYNPETRLQLRIKGKTRIIEKKSELHTEYLHQLKDSALEDYRTPLPPSSIFSQASTADQSDSIHFSAIEIIPLELDMLLLGRDEHVRYRYHPKNGNWNTVRLMP